MNIVIVVRIALIGFHIIRNTISITTTDTWVEGIFGEDSRESDRLFFMAEDEIDDKDFSMFRFVESEPVAVDYTSLFSKVKENMNMALDLNLYTQGEPLITDAAQLSSNASDKSEGLHIEYLVDGSKWVETGALGDYNCISEKALFSRHPGMWYLKSCRNWKHYSTLPDLMQHSSL